ncbi:MAG: hypothetical protein KDH96_00595 [Candidatus Riesia sp.]|nr:hypothetical protein [Candidatus Riesia sp.]
MSKIDESNEIVSAIMAKHIGVEFSSMRKIIRDECITEIKLKCNMTDAGATTYFNNSFKFLTTGEKVNYYVNTNKPGTITPFKPTGVDPTTRGMYSVVTCNANKLALYVSAHHDKNDALLEGKRSNKPVVNGLQIVGRPLGTIEQGTKCGC